MHSVPGGKTICNHPHRELLMETKSPLQVSYQLQFKKESVLKLTWDYSFFQVDAAKAPEYRGTKVSSPISSKLFNNSGTRPSGSSSSSLSHQQQSLSVGLPTSSIGSSGLSIPQPPHGTNVSSQASMLSNYPNPVAWQSCVH